MRPFIENQLRDYADHVSNLMKTPFPFLAEGDLAQIGYNKDAVEELVAIGLLSQGFSVTKLGPFDARVGSGLFYKTAAFYNAVVLSEIINGIEKILGDAQ